MGRPTITGNLKHCNYTINDYYLINILFVIFVGVSVLVMQKPIVILRGLEGNLADVFVTAIHQPTLREKTYVDPFSINNNDFDICLV